MVFVLMLFKGKASTHLVKQPIIKQTIINKYLLSEKVVGSGPFELS